MNVDMTYQEAIANLNHIYGFVSPVIKRSLDVAFKAMERPQGEWVVKRLQNGFDDVYCPFCNARPTRSEYGYYLKDNFCHECGADMRKPNCVTCDHFGKCEGCKKRDEG